MAERLIRKPAVKEKTGLCNSAIYALEGFPRPIKLGRVSCWVESEVDKWIEGKIAAARGTGRDQQVA